MGGAMTRLKVRRGRTIAIALLLGVAIATLLVMGRPMICTCGMIKLWEGGVNSPGNSQHLTDWYSFSHFIHGILFYGLLWRVGQRRWRLDTRLAIAVMIEAGWEILENSPIIINRYRAATIALGYTGDSVLNSVSDIAMMALGFLFAVRMPVRTSVAVALSFELFTLWMIRDNLTLNVLMLLWPVVAVKTWQSAI
jgi:Protein of unknown function (DUF2585)